MGAKLYPLKRVLWVTLAHPVALAALGTPYIVGSKSETEDL